MMLEEIDALCAETALRYVQGEPDFKDCGFVTAAVDHMDFLGLRLKIDADTKINTYVGYVGNSTVHVKCDIYQDYGFGYSHVADSVFIMAGRKGDKGFKMPRVDLSKEANIP